MSTDKQFLPKIEYEIALVLIKKTYDQDLDENHCSTIAKQVLQLFPENISEDALEKTLPKLKDIYSEFAPVSIKYLDLINNKKSKEQIEQVKQKINHILYGTNRRN